MVIHITSSRSGQCHVHGTDHVFSPEVYSLPGTAMALVLCGNRVRPALEMRVGLATLVERVSVSLTHFINGSSLVPRMESGRCTSYSSSRSPHRTHTRSEPADSNTCRAGSSMTSGLGNRASESGRSVFNCTYPGSGSP